MVLISIANLQLLLWFAGLAGVGLTLVVWGLAQEIRGLRSTEPDRPIGVQSDEGWEFDPSQD